MFLAAPRVRIPTPLALTADSTLISASNQLTSSDGTDGGYSGVMNVRRAHLTNPNPPVKCLDLTEFVKVSGNDFYF